MVFNLYKSNSEAGHVTQPVKYMVLKQEDPNSTPQHSFKNMGTM